MNVGALRFEPLTKSHNRAGFSSGVEALDTYLHRQARQDVERGIAAVIVLNDDEANRIVGYVTISAPSILLSDLPETMRKRLPSYPLLPAMLIGRLAVDKREHGNGYGGLLLVHALKYAHSLTARIGAIAVVVDAIDEAARSFYEKYGFIRFEPEGYRLFMAMKTIEQL